MPHPIYAITFEVLILFWSTNVRISKPNYKLKLSTPSKQRPLAFNYHFFQDPQVTFITYTTPVQQRPKCLGPDAKVVILRRFKCNFHLNNSGSFFSGLVSGSPCTVRATGSHLIVNIVESRGDEMSQEPDPSELPITGNLQVYKMIPLIYNFLFSSFLVLFKITNIKANGYNHL